MTFDSPDANVACPERTVSNTPLQALTLLNNECHAEAAQAFAARIVTSTPDEDETRLIWAWRCCVARPPSDSEQAALKRLLDAGRAYYAKHEDDAVAALGAHAPDNVAGVEAAAWVTVARVILNLDEFVTRE
jgi:hypothetical protein